MAIPGSVQALIAAFAFGILVNASSAGFVLYIIGHGSAIFRDGLRLALMLFLVSSAIWGQVSFLSTVIETSATTTCQVAVIFSSLFDQIARVAIEQYLLWAVAKSGKKGPLVMIPQLLLLARFVVGMVLVGETRVQFNPTCVPLSNSVPISITVIALDAVILTILAVQSFSTGAPKGSQTNSQGPTQSKAVLLTITGLAIWMGTSVTLLLGLNTIDLIFRTTVPAVGLFVLVVLVTIFSETLATPPARPFHSPQSPTPQTMSRDRDLSTADSSEYPPSRYEDVKGMNDMTVTQFPAEDTSRRDNNGLPKISRPITGVIGVGGLPLQGQLFPPMRSNAAEQTQNTPGEIKTRIERPKKGLRTKGASSGKITVGKLAISNPIIADSPDMQNTLNKIPTIDLATAAKYEKERRAAQAQRVSMLIANRPAPQPPKITREEAMKRSMSTKRKEIPPVPPAKEEYFEEEEPPMEILRSITGMTSQNGTSLSVEGNASSTSAQLSPGNEDLRRRSPRQSVAAAAPSKTPTFRPITPGQPIRIPIPRPQPPSEPVPAKTPEPLKTPLQRRPTTGLPSNPRAQAMRKLAQEASTQSQQTVMFVNNIVYDDPNAVNRIIQGASKTPKSPLTSSKSVVHRGRPIPRKSDKDDRQVFPAEQSPGAHRRSKSGGSIANRKSILQSTPGSPTQLPPLPPPPQSAGYGGRPQPNDTKSMTFDEKMTMFFPVPPSASSTTTTYKRQSPVPDLPPLPATFLDRKEAERAMEFEVSRRQTKTTVTDRSSVRTQSILGDDLGVGYTLTSTQNPADELGDSWLPGISTNNGKSYQQYNDGNKRKSSPIIPAGRYSEMSGRSDNKTRDDEGTTNWGSVHSPVAPVNVQGSRLNARTTYIKKESRVPSALSGYGDEVMTIMLDTNSDVDTRQSFYMDDDENSMSGRTGLRNSGAWHRRIGDDLPTFSARAERTRSRKMPPPTPLLLNAITSNKKAIVIQTAEPSPVESPEAAYQMIQAQLRQFDEPTQESGDADDSRAALLQNLELEMGQQESKWQLMQHNLDRDSMSSIQTDSRPASTVNPAARSTSSRAIIADRRASRRARMLSGSRSREEIGTEADTSRPNQWQTRLDEAQMEYMDKASDLLTKRNNLNFLSVSKADLGSPTPPDTDESDMENERAYQSLSAKVAEPIAKAHNLWQPAPPKRDIVSRALWVAPVQVFRSTESVDLPGLNVRPAARKSAEPLSIQSSQLWQKSRNQTKVRVGKGLWTKAVPLQPRESQQPQKVRPVTQRPARRTKRVTMLPDIVENPEPLPDKRGTLGIFQFPWGERSDLATVQARPSNMFVPMPGTMSSGAARLNASLEERSRQLEADEYSSSFFDDYDEEEGDNFDDSDGDDFDENTLWEIASLLKTEQVPSKNSLLPPPLSSSVIDEYATEVTSEGDAYEAPVPALSLGREEPRSINTSTLPARESLWMADASADSSRYSHGLPQPEQAIWKSYLPSRDDEVRPQARIEEIASIQSKELWVAGTQRVASKPSLWVANAGLKQSLQQFGLPQPRPTVWLSYVPADTDSVRSQTRIEEITPIESSALWTLSAKRTEPANAPLWASSKPIAKPAAPAAARQPRQPRRDAQAQRASLMWEMPASNPESQVGGLFQVNTGRKVFRTTSAEPAALDLVRSQTRIEEITPVESNELWMLSTGRAEAVNAPLWASAKPTAKPIAKPTAKATAPAAIRQPRRDAQPLQRSSSMWEKPASHPESQVDGLFQVNTGRKVFRTTLAEPAALDLVRSQTRIEEITPVESSELWMLSTSGTETVNAPLWASAKPITKPTAKPTVKPTVKPAAPVAARQTRRDPQVPQGSNLMWAKPASNPESQADGLFQVNTGRKAFRTTSAEPAALDMVLAPRKVLSTMAQLQSTHFWRATNGKKADVNWIKASSSGSAKSSPSLFTIDPARKVYRTTDAEPAALTMVTKPRKSSDAPLPQLQSTQLWSVHGRGAVELDWISISSIRPRSPSMASVGSTNSSSLSSPVTDVASVKTNFTKASSIAESVSSSFGLDGWLVNKNAPDVPHVPEVPLNFVVKNLDPVSREKSASTPSFAVVHATESQWDEALQAAVKASHIAPKIARRTATPREWSNALAQAVAASYPQNRFSRGQVLGHHWEAELLEAIARSKRNSFDVSKRHPVFAATSMTSTSTMIHPAAIGYSYDVATRHPVFFGSMVTTCPEVHPAMSGLGSNTASKPSQPLLWSHLKQSSSANAQKVMWTPSATTPMARVEAPRLPELDAQSFRHQSHVSVSDEVSVDADFGEDGMWARGGGLKRADSSAGKDWLDDTMKKRFSRIELRY